MVFVFGDFEADEERFELRRRGRQVRVQRRVLDTIFLLLRREGRLVTKEDLIAGPWNGAVVSDGAFNQAIMLARRALKSKAGDPIATVRGKGFRFSIAVEKRRAETLLPETVAAAIRARLFQLPNSTRTLLVSAAVLGQEFAWSQLRECVGLSEDDARAALRPALALALIRRSASTDVRLHFADALIREAILEDLPPGLRAAEPWGHPRGPQDGSRTEALALERK